MIDFSGKSLGRYHITEKLGEGGMAVVYKAYDTHLECDVAVKIIRTDQLIPATLDRTSKRFEKEAKEVAKLTHPNIVKVTDYGEFEGMPYLVMEYLHGGTLKQIMGRPLPVKKAVQLLRPIALALEYAHVHKILHRDVKPSNILITDTGEPMLADFGIAKILETEAGHTLTGTGVGLGTPEYMAPEQWMGKANFASDQYSLGVVFYEMITGKKPYTADTPIAVLLKQANEPLPRPGVFIKGIPENAERVLFKCLAKKPEDRYQNMGEFASALAGLVEREKDASTIKNGEEIQQVNPHQDIEEFTTLDVDKTNHQLDTATLKPPPLILRKINPAKKEKLNSVLEQSQKKNIEKLLSVLNFSKQKPFWFGLALVILVGGGYFIATSFGGNGKPLPVSVVSSTPTKSVTKLPPTAVQTSTPSPSPTTGPTATSTATLPPAVLIFKKNAYIQCKYVPYDFGSRITDLSYRNVYVVNGVDEKNSWLNIAIEPKKYATSEIISDCWVKKSDYIDVSREITTILTHKPLRTVWKLDVHGYMVDSSGNMELVYEVRYTNVESYEKAESLINYECAWFWGHGTERHCSYTISNPYQIDLYNVVYNRINTVRDWVGFK